MRNRSGVFLQTAIGCALCLLAGCSINPSTGGSGGAQGGQSSGGSGGSGGSSTGAGGTSAGSGGQVGGSGGKSSQSGGQTTTSSGGEAGKTSSVVRTGGTTSRGQGGGTGGQVVAATGGSGPGGAGSGTGGQSAGATGQAGQTGKGGQTAGATGQAGQTGKGGQAGSTGILTNTCTGKPVPTANPAAAGPFAVAADKGVGPLAGYTPDPIYGDEQQRFNIYRPKDMATNGYCHPILVWANGHTDNPEPNPPKCVTDSGANKWCGQYLPMMQHLASHGFVVIASLSTTTSRGDPLPTIAGLDWLLQQAEDPTSPYYHHLDTSNIGQLGHSEGAMSTCMSASEPRYKALAAICGTRTLTGLHTPILLYCGGKDTTVKCDGVKQVFDTITDQPAFFIDELASDHGWWVYQGASGVSLSMAAAWFRVHLMNDTANRKYFYGSGCTFCKDSRVQSAQNSLMAQ